MRFSFDRQSSVPLYQQIVAYMRQGILSGSLAPETRLPAIRQLAADLGVNRITVEKAYAELEADGLIFTRVGSGTFVLPQDPFPVVEKSPLDTPWPLWQMDASNPHVTPYQARVEEMVRASKHPDPINFSKGSGDASLFPAEDFRKVIQNVMRRDGAGALDYGDVSGYLPLRSMIAHVLSSQGLQTLPENVMITAGSQQALALVLRLLMKPGDVIFTEKPTYSGALNLFRSLNLVPVGVPVDERGMQVEKMEILLKKYHPKMIYTIPNFQNPTGTCLSVPRRRQLIALADQYNVPILEDDFVGDLRYDGHALPALKSLDPGGRVIYISTFSKMLMPGLRVGFLAVEGPIYESLLNFKHVNDLATSNLIQRALEAYVSVGSYQAHLRRSCHVYRKRRDAMLTAINRHLPAGVQVSPPQGGLFIWLHLPDNLSSEELLPLAIEEGVLFSPGNSFFPDGVEGKDFLRLNFVNHSPEEIDQGIRRLGAAIKRLAISKWVAYSSGK
jgi:GntR family transcriptional regulator/MocR family aminotransferase